MQTLHTHTHTHKHSHMCVKDGLKSDLYTKYQVCEWVWILTMIESDCRASESLVSLPVDVVCCLVKSTWFHGLISSLLIIGYRDYITIIINAIIIKMLLGIIENKVTPSNTQRNAQKGEENHK